MNKDKNKNKDKNNFDFDFDNMLAQAASAKLELRLLDTKQKNDILTSMAAGLAENRNKILQANKLDIENAKKAQLSEALIDRLLLNNDRLDSMITAIETIINLQDPVDKSLSEFAHPNGMMIQKRSVPIGMIGVIYESRPNVTSDVAALCLKAGNGVILRGGKESINSNIAIYEAMLEPAIASGLPVGAISFVYDIKRDLVKKIAQADQVLDLIIPRGGKSLITSVAKDATVPIIKHDKGLCHIYVDASADLDQALDIIINAKCQRPGVCNAVETVLIDEKIAAEFLTVLAKELADYNCEIRADAQACKFMPEAKLASESDWSCEYLDLILAVKIVSNKDNNKSAVQAAIEHIQEYGSGHSEAIIAKDKEVAKLFVQQVDAACVYINASTRFTDGSEFGMGAEIGISTNKMHARGPMGLEELTTYQYVIKGSGQVRP